MLETFVVKFPVEQLYNSLEKNKFKTGSKQDVKTIAQTTRAKE
jgi:hypothetical protein